MSVIDIFVLEKLHTRSLKIEDLCSSLNKKIRLYIVRFRNPLFKVARFDPQVSLVARYLEIEDLSFSSLLNALRKSLSYSRNCMELRNARIKTEDRKQPLSQSTVAAVAASHRKKARSCVGEASDCNYHCTTRPIFTSQHLMQRIDRSLDSKNLAVG